MKTELTIQQPAAGARPGSGPADARLCIWLSDYDADYGEHLVQSLKVQSGVEEVRGFSSALSLLAALRQGPPPAAVLLDAQMPALNGLAAVRPIKHLAPATVVLMLTTFFDYHLKKQALAAGATDLLLKRNSPAQIVAAIRSATGPVASAASGPHPAWRWWQIV